MNIPAPYIYKKGYIIVPVSLSRAEDLPETVWLGATSFAKKREFHVTIIDTNATTLSSSAEQEILIRVFNGSVAKQPIVFNRLQDEFRHAIRGKEETILAMADVHGVREFFEALNGELNRKLPIQPAHVTLYMHESEIGIGVSSFDQMASYELVQLPEVSSVLFHT